MGLDVAFPLPTLPERLPKSFVRPEETGQCSMVRQVVRNPLAKVQFPNLQNGTRHSRLHIFECIGRVAFFLTIYLDCESANFIHNLSLYGIPCILP